MVAEAETRPFADLVPEVVLDAVDATGVHCDGRLIALASYENRVYQVGVEDAPPLVVKFYRPGRWSDDAIREEHGFALELESREVPVAAPRAGPAGDTLLVHHGYRYAVFPRLAGEWPELDDPERRRTMGRFIGRIHAVGALRTFRHRPALDVETHGEEPRRWLLEHGVVPPEHQGAYGSRSAEALDAVRESFARVGAVRRIRLHGDCHLGNVLWGELGPSFVDLDDCRTGPAIQDLWMLLSGDLDERRAQVADLVSGYRTFHDLDARELGLVEALRTLRIVHYTAWLARRWDDPAFPVAFPWFGTDRYWRDHLQALEDQCRAMAEPPLDLYD